MIEVRFVILRRCFRTMKGFTILNIAMLFLQAKLFYAIFNAFLGKYIYAQMLFLITWKNPFAVQDRF